MNLVSEPTLLQESFQDTRSFGLIRFNRESKYFSSLLTIVEGVQVAGAATRLVALGILLSFARADVGPDSLSCDHQPDPMSHHWRMDEWVVTDDQHHRLVNYCKADRCDVIWKYDDVDVLIFADEQAAHRSTTAHSIFTQQDSLNLT